ncbi:MAG: hypothetical protein CSA47_01715 [Gammaproteobacteria bacterium]|nr:MAG: hypothetical protein CSA47_01715 [Gammaproteobacteria bacterium]
MTKKRWTLNADVGEGCDDTLIMPFLDCANICCGMHAGSEAITQKTIALAESYNVTVGAHPGYADAEHFGRLSLDLTPAQLHETLHAQISLLDQLSKKLAYVKPHGALNHDMLKNDSIFAKICEVTASINPNLALMVPTNARQASQQAIADKYGLTIWWEVFADRAYQPDGLLRPRKYDDAVHRDSERIVEQIRRIRDRESIVAVDGTEIDISTARTICVHGDNSASVQAIRKLSVSEHQNQ